MSDQPLSDYGLVSDCHSAALISRGGSVDWLSFPRFDSPAVFARLLDEDAGHWVIRPVGEWSATRRYADGSLVLETRYESGTGAVVLTDALAVGADEAGHELGQRTPHALLRQVRGERGEVEMELEFAPRPEYGVVCPLLVKVPGGVTSHGGAAVLRLSSPVGLELDGSFARARFRVRAGESVGFALHYRPTREPPPEEWSADTVDRSLEDTRHAWRTWSEMHQSYRGPWSELVNLSGRVLQGLTYYPTGAIIAAPTTSLPEVVGGERNWDYRYCWVRDASFTLQALWVAACPDESEKFFNFLARVALAPIRHGDHLQIMIGVGGEHDLTERELPHLRGWRGSRPVRIGNAAWDQTQLDVYGELLAAVYQLRDNLPDFDEVTLEFLAYLADAAAKRWREPDHGIWEIRGERRHYVYSKLMCWVALDRALKLADVLGADEERVGRWEAAREEIREAILERGWSDRERAFTQTFEGEALDASNLVMPLVGFLPATDERVRATVEATVQRLTDSNGLVFRYLADDGMEGEEGTFLLCTFWLAEAQARMGDLDRARETFRAAVRNVNEIGLLSEQVARGTGELVGNFPQAFSHIGLINAAWAIAQGEENGE